MSGNIEIAHPPEDSISCLKFSPECVPQTFLIGSSWANDIRCWQIDESGKSTPKAVKTMDAPVLSCAWSQDGTKVMYFLLLHQIYIKNFKNDYFKF